MTPHYIVRHGRRIEVETINTGANPSKVRRREADLFIKVPLQWAAAAAKATKTSKALVWLLLRHMAWQTKSSTFPFPNGMLRRHGVTRETKRRALAELEAAGLISVRRRHGRASIVTLIGG
jgi:hypothetical protein